MRCLVDLNPNYKSLTLSSVALGQRYTNLKVQVEKIEHTKNTKKNIAMTDRLVTLYPAWWQSVILYSFCIYGALGFLPPALRA